MEKKNENMQFLNSTLKYEGDSYIQGSDGLYIFQFTTGTKLDLRQELINYHAKKYDLMDMVKGDDSKVSNISAFSWSIFKKPEDQSYEDFIEAIQNYKVGMIGNCPLIFTQRNYRQVDMNGNILAATFNSELNRYADGCGNILINSKGEVIRAPKASVIIYPADPKTGFYPIEIYKTAENKETGRPDVIDREYNFLSPEGKILSSEDNFSTHDGRSVIYDVPRNFYARDGKMVINDWKIYPSAHVLCEWNKTELFLSAIDLVMENRIASGDLPIVEDEKPYLTWYFDRKVELEAQMDKLGMMLDANKITQSTYDKIMKEINKEYARHELFETQYKTPEDRLLEEEFLQDMGM